MAKKKQVLYPVLFMLILTAAYTFVLAFINESTIAIIEAQEELRIQKSILYVFDIPFEDQQAAVNKLYNERFDIATSGDMTYYVYKTEGSVVGYAFPLYGNGLWGSISGYIALSPDFETLLGIDFIAHSETPGLGGRIDEEWYKEQFRTLDVSSDPPVVYRPVSGGNVDAITGATLTSKSVSTIINDFMTEIKIFAEEENLYDGSN
ncbi:MAG: FMN-binding protein [Clostridia bacterium]|nr:FMN-binding protein [Clostridia bacterium]